MKPSPAFRLPAFAIKFSEGEIGFDPTKPQQVFRVGTFWHESYGQFTLTKEMLANMVKNFKENVRGIDLAIDYSHRNEGEAAGWFKDVMLGENGESLWAIFDWTKTAAQKLSDKEFRYISPEFHPDYQDNESLKTFGATLLGAGLTNRPTIKNMEPVVQLAETPNDHQKLLDAQKARSEKYGIEILPETSLTPPAGQPQDEGSYADPVNYNYPIADAAQAGNARVRFKQFAMKSYTNDSSRAKVHDRIVEKELGLGVKPDFNENDPLDKLLSPELKAKLVKQQPKPKEVKKMGDQKPIDQMSPEELMAYCKDLQKQLSDMQLSMKQANEQKALTEKKSTFAKMLSEGKVVAAQEESFLKGDMIKFTELAQPVNTAAKGQGGEGAPNVTEPKTREEAETKVMELAEKKLADKSAKTLSEAYQKVLSENKELKNKLYPQRG